MILRVHLEQALLRMWQRRGVGARLLYPLTLVHRAWRAFDAWRYGSGLVRPERVGVPVVVVGNLYVGGTGKTPLVIEIVRALKARGWHPGVVARGYRAAVAPPREVDPRGAARDFGDEPLLMAQAAGVPVAVGRDRVAAAKLLRNLHPRVDVIVTDDGLQHRRLARDVEIAVIHYRGLGNGWLLPAGPLRDPPQRLQDVSAVVFHGDILPVRIYSPHFFMRTQLGTVYALKDPSRKIDLSELAREQRDKGVRLLAAAGTGTPDRFFAMLRAHGLQFEALPLPDHYDYADNPFANRRFDCALITEKDAVKCRDNPALAADGRLCVVPLQTTVHAALIDLIEQRIGAPPGAAAVPAARAEQFSKAKAADGSPTA
ncbi:MAG: tetraacyldisaccharide 4'-kinase [Burkholderiaceae bacterium]